jgi:hypothetical protein
MLLEEAESKGLAATEAEIEEHVTTLKKGYADYPEVKKQVDEYCDGAELQYVNATSPIVNFSIDSSGNATIKLNCTGKSTITKITAKTFTK